MRVLILLPRLLAAFSFLCVISEVSAVTFRPKSSTNWNLPATWETNTGFLGAYVAATGVPTNADDILLLQGFTITVPNGFAAVCRNITVTAPGLFGATGIAGVTVNGSLAMTGTISLATDRAGSITNITVGGTGSVTTGAVTINPTGGSVNFAIDGSLVANGLTVNSAANAVAFSGSGSTNFGAGGMNFIGTAIAVSSTLSAATLTIPGTATTITGTGIFSVSGAAAVTVGAAISMTCNGVSASTFSVNSAANATATLTIGTITTTSDFSITNATGGFTAAGPVNITSNSINTGGVFTVTNAAPGIGGGTASKTITTGALTVGNGVNCTAGTIALGLTSGTSTITGNTVLSGTALAINLGNTTSGGSLTFNGTNTTATLLANTLSLTGGYTQTGGASAFGALSVGGAFSLTGGTNTNAVGFSSITVTGATTITGTSGSNYLSGTTFTANGGATFSGAILMADNFGIGSGLQLNGSATNTNYVEVKVLSGAGSCAMNNGFNTFTVRSVSSISGNLSMTNGTAASQNLLWLKGPLTVGGSTGVTMTTTTSNIAAANLINIGTADSSGSLIISVNDLNMAGTALAGTNIENDIELYQGTLSVRDDINVSNTSGTTLHNKIQWNDNTTFDGKSKSLYLGGNVSNTALGTLLMADANNNSGFTAYFNGTKKQTIPASDSWNFKRIEVSNTTDSVCFGGILSRAGNRLMGKMKVNSNSKLADNGYDFGGTGADSLEVEPSGMFVIEHLTQQFPDVIENVNISNNGVIYFLNNSASTQQILGGNLTKVIPTVKVGGTGLKQVQSDFVTVAGCNQVQHLSVEGGTLSFAPRVTFFNLVSGSQTITQQVTVLNGATLDIPRNFAADPSAKFTFGLTSTTVYSGAADQKVYRFHANAVASGALAAHGNLTFSGAGAKTMATNDSCKVARKLTIGSAFTIGSNGSLTILSDATNTGWVGTITGSIAYSGSGATKGKMIVQRYIGLPDPNYRDFSSPVKGMTLKDWENNGVEISGVPGSLYPIQTPQYANAYTYIESTAGNLEEGWQEAADISEPIQNMSGSTMNRGGWRIYGGRATGLYAFTMKDAGEIYTG
ncbi:MAG: hypothetical protein V4616_10335, partial [Bacteroidota bacterium]